jgi:hypothetical protein
VIATYFLSWHEIYILTTQTEGTEETGVLTSFNRRTRQDTYICNLREYVETTILFKTFRIQISLADG